MAYHKFCSTKKTLYLILGAVFLAVLSWAGSSFAIKEASPTSGQPIIVSDSSTVTVTPAPSAIIAPQGLTPREKNELEKDYRFAVRDKASLLNPYVGSNATSGDEAVGFEPGQTEDERLYRYFGVAMQLYKDGRLGEAIEILRYISDKKPEDKYVKTCLDKVVAEQESGRKRWISKAKVESSAIRRDMLKNMMKDGIDYYKQKRFDMALLKFADLLSMDPDNAEAKKYFEKLKEHYLKETRVEDVVASYEAGESVPEAITVGGVANKIMDDEERDIKIAVRKILDDEEAAVKSAELRLLDPKGNGRSEQTAKILKKEEAELEVFVDRLLDEEETSKLVQDKRLSLMLDQADLGLVVENIIEKAKKEESRKDMFTLGPGDVINVMVRDHPELSGRMVVRLDGNIILPLVNDPVKVSRLTVDEVSAAVTEVVKRYVKEPYVSAIIEEYKSKRFYVIDEVGCTPYPVTRANLTLRDALFVADWGNNRALGRVIVMTPDKIHPIVRKIDAFDIIYRGNLQNNIRISDGDVIYIPITAAAKITKTIVDAVSPVAAINIAKDQWLNTKWNTQGWQNVGRIPRTQELQDLYGDPEENNNAAGSGISYLTLGN